MHAFVFDRRIPIGWLATVETLKGGFQAIDTSSLLLVRLTESQSLRGKFNAKHLVRRLQVSGREKVKQSFHFSCTTRRVASRKDVFNTVGENEQVIELLQGNPTTTHLSQANWNFRSHWSTLWPSRTCELIIHGKMANQTATSTKPLSEAIPLGILGVLITLENLLVCFLVYRFRKLRTFTNGFVVSLALSDVLFGAVLIPVNITDEKNPVNAYLISFILFANVTNLFAVTLDRYLAVMNSLRYSYTMTKYFVKILLTAWILPVPLTLLPLAWNHGSTAETIYLFFIVIGVMVPYIFILFAYIKIFREVARQVKNLAKLATYENQLQATKEGKRVTSEARVARVFAIIAGIFVISWMPVFYMTAADALNRDEVIPPVLPIVSWYTMTAGSLANAAVYAFFKGDFRNAFLRLFHCRTVNFRRHSSDEAISGTSLNWKPTLDILSRMFARWSVVYCSGSLITYLS